MNLDKNYFEKVISRGQKDAKSMGTFRYAHEHCIISLLKNKTEIVPIFTNYLKSIEFHRALI